MYLSAHDIHQELGGHLSVWTIRQYMANGTIQARKIGNKWLCTRKQFGDYLQRCKSSTNLQQVTEAKMTSTRTATKPLPDLRRASIKEIIAATSC